MKRNLDELSEYTWGRTRQRLVGLTDEEYFWEPVRGCWTVRSAADGYYRPDGGPEVDPPSVTTIAWRMSHLVVCYGEKRNREWLGCPGDALKGVESVDPAASSADDAIERLEAAYREWAAVLGSLEEEHLGEKLGPAAGPFAEADRCDFVLHMLDEFIHHGAEIALLRDLWRAQPPSG